MKKSLIMLGALAGLAIGGVALSISTKRAQSVNAEYGTTKTIYLDLGDASWWLNGDGSKAPNGFRIQYWKNGETTTVVSAASLSYAGLTYMYSVEIPTDVDGFLLNAYGGSTAWWDKSYQTVNFTVGSTYDFLTLTDGGYECNYNGSWSVFPEAASGTVYFVNGDSWATPMVHYWGGDSQSTWHGVSMTEVTNVSLVVDGSSYGIWSYAAVPSCRYLIFNDNDSSQTERLTMSANGIYFSGLDAKYSDVVDLLLTVKNSLGTANIASANNEQYENTICGISSENITSIINAYNTLINDSDESIVSSAQNSTLTTYNPTNYSNETAVNMQDIVDELSAKAAQGVNRVEATRSDNSPVVPIASVGVIGVIGTAGFFFIRKKRLL